MDNTHNDNDDGMDYGTAMNDRPSAARAWIPVNGLAAVLIVTVLIIMSAAAYQLITFAGGIETASSATGTDTGTGTVTASSVTDPSETDQTGGTDSGAIELARQIALQAGQIELLTQKRSEIIDALIAKSSELGLNIDIDIVTGAVRFSEAQFFEKNSDQMNEVGQQYLTDFIPTYLSTVVKIAGEDLDQIVIEGHADEEGTYLLNLNLSQRRSYSVAAFIFNNGLADIEGIDEPEKLISISGRSYSIPIYTDGVIDREKSRRVEFRFRLKDEDAINEIKALFDSFLQEGAGD